MWISKDKLEEMLEAKYNEGKFSKPSKSLRRKNKYHVYIDGDYALSVEATDIIKDNDIYTFMLDCSISAMIVTNKDVIIELYEDEKD